MPRVIAFALMTGLLLCLPACQGSRGSAELEAVAKLENLVKQEMNERLVRIDEAIAEFKRSTTPVGTILLWWGNVNDVPTGWELCDGQGPTTEGATLPGAKPDLRSKFVRGASGEDHTSGELGEGGQAEIMLRHVHGAGSLRAKIGLHGETSNRMSLWPSGGALAGNQTKGREFALGSAADKPGGAPYSGTAVDGNTALATLADEKGRPSHKELTTQDNCPPYQEVFFIIRVK